MNFQHPRQCGFSMIEVLVAVLILSFGITSIGMMMLATLQNARGATFRSKAVAHTQDMAERIRANYEGREFYDTDATTGADNGCFQAGSSAPSTCSAQQLAQHDIWQWRQSLSDTALGLPDGTGTIRLDASTTPTQYAIQVNWTDGSGANGLITGTFNLSTRP